MVKLWWRLVRFGFRLLYNELACTYDLVSMIVSLGAWRCWQQAALRHLNAPAGSHILELAHGTGNLQLDLYARGYRPIGYDLSPYMGRIASGKLRQQGLPVRLAQGRVQQLSFPAASFPAVVCTFPTNFIFQPDTLREIQRVLQSEGLLLIVPNGVLTGSSIPAAALEGLYRITGQRGEDQVDIQSYMAEFGFTAQVVTERCPHSVATVIIAQKLP